jgi:hypothetical protein
MLVRVRRLEHPYNRPRAVTGWMFAAWMVINLLAVLVIFRWNERALEEYVTFHSKSLIPREELGYDHLPEYVISRKKRHPRPPFFGTYLNEWHDYGPFVYYVWDMPHWPEGDPGLGDKNPLPPLVARGEIYGVSPELPLGLLTGGWICWGVLWGRKFLRNRFSKGHGFEVRLITPNAIDGAAGMHSGCPSDSPR